MTPYIFLTSSIDEVANKVYKITSTILQTLKPKLLFITTAAEAEKDKSYVEIDHKALIAAGFQVYDFTLTNKSPQEIEKAIKENAIIHLNGGNSFYLMQQIKISGFDKLIKHYLKKGKIYSGSSAGSIVAGPTLELARYYDDPKKAPKLEKFKGLELVDFVVYPHWGNSYFKKDFMKKENLELFYNFKGKIILLRDNQFIETDGKIVKLHQINY